MNHLIEKIKKFNNWPNADELLNSLDEVVVFGTGGAAVCVTAILKQFNIKVLYYVDNDSEKHGSVFYDKPVFAPEKVYQDKHPILLASYWARDIALQLKEHDLQYYDLSFCVDFSRWKGHFDCNQFDYKSALKYAQEYLDGDDLKAYLGCIRYRQTYDPLDLNIPNHEHYLHPKILPTASDVYIDGGAWHGDTLLELKQLFGDNIQIHSFEPDSSNFEKLSHAISENKLLNVTTEKLALWDKEQTLEFLCSDEAVHTMQSRVSDELIEAERSIKVQAIDLDSYCTKMDITPTFIKLDVEGAELQVIRGSKRVLKNYQPKLALSAYHEPNHIWEIFTAIKTINPNYRFYFTHHSQHLFESVIYASVEG